MMHFQYLVLYLENDRLVLMWPKNVNKDSPIEIPNDANLFPGFLVPCDICADFKNLTTTIQSAPPNPRRRNFNSQIQGNFPRYSILSLSS